MRIVGGTHSSRKLETPKSDAVRPTSDKVRQAIFNMLQSRGVVQDAVVIDAFCGTGALGLEALSQGAKFCTFFDKNKNSLQTCKNNIDVLQEGENSKTIFKDIVKIEIKPDDMKPATLVFFDPPYHKNLIPQALQALYDGQWLDQSCFFVMETAKNEVIESSLVETENEKIYGDTKITLATLKDTAVN